MNPRRPRPRPDADEMPPLPPLDGADDEPLADEHDLHDLPRGDDDDASLDDAAADELGSDDEIASDEPESGWAEDADDADDADVGDLAEGIALDESSSWLGEDPARETDDSDADLDDGGELIDDGEDGPAEDEDFVLDPGVEMIHDDPGDDAAVDPFLDADATIPLLDEPPAFALPAPSSTPPHAIVHTDGSVSAAAVRGTRVILAGDGTYALNLPAAAALDGRGLNARTVDADPRMHVTSMIAVGPRAFLAATRDGHVRRSDDAGAHWESVGALAGDHEPYDAVELLAEPLLEGTRIWARAHGGLFRSDDGGRRWDGPVIEQSIRAIASDSSGGITIVTAGAAPALVRVMDGSRIVTVPYDLPAGRAPVLLACGAGVTVLAFARGPGVVSMPDGAVTQWPLLESATAALVAQTDDGAPQIVAAVHDETTGHTTLVSAAIDAAGQPRHPRRFADLDALLPPGTDENHDPDDARADALVALDPGARRVLVITPRGVLIAARAGGAPARPGPTGTDD